MRGALRCDRPEVLRPAAGSQPSFVVSMKHTTTAKSVTPSMNAAVMIMLPLMSPAA